VDAADPAFRDQYQVTRQVLEEIGAGENPALLVLNKADQLTDAQKVELQAEFPDAVLMSARSAGDVQRLHQHIVAYFEQGMEETEYLVPYSEPRLVALLHERTRVLAESYEEQGTRVRVRAPKAVLAGLAGEVERSAGS
jgi:GTP-binding protein HflX